MTQSFSKNIASICERPKRWIAVLTIGCVLVSTPLYAQLNNKPEELKGVDVEQKLGVNIDLSQKFTNHFGQEIELKDLFKGDKPVLLTLNYYDCPMLCTLQLTYLVNMLKQINWSVGNEFRMVTVSINHKESADDAKRKRAKYLKDLGQGPVDWSFLVGSEENIKKLADTVGFKFQYDEKTKQYAHAAVLFVTSPDGKVSRYLFGNSYPSRDVKLALVDASEGKVGSPIDKIILSCFHYDAATGRYSPFAFGIMRIGGIVALAAVLTLLLFYWRREKLKQRANHESGSIDGKREDVA